MGGWFRGVPPVVLVRACGHGADGVRLPKAQLRSAYHPRPGRGYTHGQSQSCYCCCFESDPAVAGYCGLLGLAHELVQPGQCRQRGGASWEDLASHSTFTSGRI
jgi:hypothetical protein